MCMKDFRIASTFHAKYGLLLLIEHGDVVYGRYTDVPDTWDMILMTIDEVIVHTDWKVQRLEQLDEHAQGLVFEFFLGAP